MAPHTRFLTVPVGRMMVEGRIRLPAHARLTVTTTVEEVRSKIFGTSEVFTHTADQLHAHRLRPFTVLEALEAGLILGPRWRMSRLWPLARPTVTIPPVTILLEMASYLTMTPGIETVVGVFV
jgi:hypothetical protein